MRESTRKSRLLEKRAGGGEKDADVAAPDSLQRLDPIAGYFGVRLSFAEALTGRVERDESCISKRFEIGQPALGSGHAFGDNYEKSALGGARKGGYGDRVAGTCETGCV